ncbi:AAA family ATPase [Metallosphaera javensis (ex Sakai et al. 2022)]|uniref:AAA family ATPase n=1 Tax=Metallosphaera javensis (ex Sakai et al. 2022) TaxID=2775498 RepID=UPI00258AA104|nr:MAG: AAA family ATPase [Metallosphaera javensis (ex Sakai et al. 2022)]
MFGKWLAPRKGLEYLDSYLYITDQKELEDSINKLVALTDRQPERICMFISNRDNYQHWMNSFRYSLYGETSYILWGDVADNKGNDVLTGFPFKGLVEAYGNQIKENTIDRPLLALFYVKNSIFGFGLITDINYDILRNFAFWNESERIWKIRVRMKVLYIHKKLRDSPESDWESFGDTPFDPLPDCRLSRNSNNCFNDPEIVKCLLDNYIRLKKNEIKETLLFYRKIYQETNSSRPQEEAIQQQTQLEINRTPRQITCSKTTDIALDGLYINSPFDISKLKSYLKAGIENGNLLLVGPPGVGKTEVAERLAQYFAGDNCYTIATANSLWFRRDVIGGETIQGGSVAWRSGILIRAYNRAAEIKDSGNYVVIIDEINRADIDKAFGEFFTIFSNTDPSKWKIPSYLIEEIQSYDDRIDQEAKDFLRHYGEHKNAPLTRLRIIATMNLVDFRNLFDIGSALSRRFFVFEFRYPKGVEDLDAFNIQVDDKVKEFVKCLRERFASLKSSKDSMEGFDTRSTFNISPASLRKAIIVYSALENKDVLSFGKILKSTLGTVNSRDLKNYDIFMEECEKVAEKG